VGEKWPRDTAAVITVGVLGVTAILISPITPWVLGVAVFGLELFAPAVFVLLVWFLQNG
jgi:hypothetical protein